MATTCIACHEPESPHEDQFDTRSCEECHAESVWEEAERFDHNESRFKLTGEHRQVSCEDCHEPIRNPDSELYVQYVDLEFSTCESCHRDVHEGELGAKCTSCHSTMGWHRFRRSTFEPGFDHETTDFPLVGSHAEVDCAVCHGKLPTRNRTVYIAYTRESRGFQYPHPVATTCASCHVDYHRDVFAETLTGLYQFDSRTTDFFPGFKNPSNKPLELFATSS